MWRTALTEFISAFVELKQCFSDFVSLEATLLCFEARRRVVTPSDKLDQSLSRFGVSSQQNSNHQAQSWRKHRHEWCAKTKSDCVRFPCKKIKIKPEVILGRSSCLDSSNVTKMTRLSHITSARQNDFQKKFAPNQLALQSENVRVRFSYRKQHRSLWGTSSRGEGHNSEKQGICCPG